jgi:hypothetical protein
LGRLRADEREAKLGCLFAQSSEFTFSMFLFVSLCPNVYDVSAENRYSI